MTDKTAEDLRVAMPARAQNYVISGPSVYVDGERSVLIDTPRQAQTFEDYFALDAAKPIPEPAVVERDDSALVDGFFRTWGASVHKHDMLAQLLSEVRYSRDSEWRAALEKGRSEP